MRKHDFRKRYRKGKRVNKHHVVPRAAAGRDTADNVVYLDRRLHDALHAVFGCHPPSEYFTIAASDPEEFARRTVRALARTFGPSVVFDAFRVA